MPLQSPKDEMGSSPKGEANSGFVRSAQFQSKVQCLEGVLGVNHIEEHYSN